MAGPGAKAPLAFQPKMRLDKWLWAARFFKTRGLAVEMIEGGKLRLNAQPCRKAGHALAVGDVLTFAMARQIRVIRVLALHEKRGPAEQAQTLYLDLAPQPSGDSDDV